MAYQPYLEKRGWVESPIGRDGGLKKHSSPWNSKAFLSVYVMGWEKARREKKQEDKLTKKDTAEEEREKGMQPK